LTACLRPLAIASAAFFLWETRTGQEFLTLRGHTGSIHRIGWVAGTDSLVTAGEDGTLRAWDLHSGKISYRWDAHAGGVLALDVHPGGRIVSAGRDRRVKVWETDGRLVANLGPTADEATRVTWAADARSLASGDGSGEVRLWNLADSTSSRLPSPVASRPADVALVEPVLRPARPASPRTPDRPPTSAVSHPGSVIPAPAEDLDAVRAAAAAAEQAVVRLSRLADFSGRPSRRPVSALEAARSALTSLRTALAAQPGDVALTRAVEETERAVRLLEQSAARPAAEPGIPMNRP
jgi:hypothetical protein